MNNLKAVLDLGSLKAKLSIFNTDTATLVYNTSYLILLGKGISENHIVDEKALQLLQEALVKVAEEIKNRDINQIEIIATEALRRASNKDKVQSLVSEHFPASTIKIIDQEIEGRLFFTAVSKHFPDKDIVTIDIGGGSVQIFNGRYDSSVDSTEIKSKHLLKTGTYYLQQKYSPDNNVISDDFEKAKAEIIEHYKQVNLKSEIIIFGSTCMLDFILESKIDNIKNNEYNHHPIHILPNSLHSLLDQLRELPPNKREHFYPSGGYFMHGADYLLLNLLQLAKVTETTKIYPTNLNSSYGLI